MSSTAMSLSVQTGSSTLKPLRFSLRGLGTVVAAVAANALFYVIGSAVVAYDPEFLPLADVWLYLCHGGVDQGAAQALSAFLYLCICGVLGSLAWRFARNPALAALAAAPFSPPAPAELGVDAGVARALVREGAAVDLDAPAVDE